MRSLLMLSLLALAVSGCQRSHRTRYQGYLEGEFVYVAAPQSGRLDQLAVTRGTTVSAGATLFQLEQEAERASQRQAENQLRAAQARLADLKKGSRPEEIAALAARLDQARAATELSNLEFERIAALHKTNVVSDNDFDRARLSHEQALRQADELAAQLATARLGGRSDAIAALDAEVAAATAAKQRADWTFAQRTQTSPVDALVYDTLYRPGEFVAAGAPIVALLPPGNLKVRFFVPEADFAKLQPGATVQVSVTGKDAPLPARITYLSPKPEYTPPILYNRENRAKLVFMVEGIFDTAVARELHPGQPVDVAGPTG